MALGERFIVINANVSPPSRSAGAAATTRSAEKQSVSTTSSCNAFLPNLTFRAVESQTADVFLPDPAATLKMSYTDFLHVIVEKISAESAAPSRSRQTAHSELNASIPWFL